MTDDRFTPLVILERWVSLLFYEFKCYGDGVECQHWGTVALMRFPVSNRSWAIKDDDDYECYGEIEEYCVALLQGTIEKYFVEEIDGLPFSHIDRSYSPIQFRAHNRNINRAGRLFLTTSDSVLLD